MADLYGGGYVIGGYAPLGLAPVVPDQAFGDTPDLSVQVDFVHDINPQTDPLPDPIWSELVHLLRSPQGFQTNRGRPRTVDKIEAGTASATFDDFDRELDPSNPDSTHAPNIVPSRRVRFSSVHETTTTAFRLGSSQLGGGDSLGGGPGIVRNVFWDGVIDSWAYDYPEKGFDATVTIRATDLFGVMNKDPVLISPFAAGQVAEMLNFLLNERAYTGRVPGSQNTPASSPARDISEANGLSTVINSLNTNMLEAARQLADSGGGAFFVSRDGRFTYRDRLWPFRPTDPALRFAIDAELYKDLSRTFDESLIVNDVTVEAQVSGVPVQVQVSDAASKARFGTREWPGGVLTTVLGLTTDATTRATEVLRKYRQPHIGITRLDLSDLVQDWLLVLGLEIWDKIIAEVPMPNGDIITQVLLVEGIAISSTSRQRWAPILSLAAAPFPELLTEEQQSFEGGTFLGWHAGANTTLTVPTPGGGGPGQPGKPAPAHGSRMLQLTPTGAGDVSAYTDPIPIESRVTYDTFLSAAPPLRAVGVAVEKTVRLEIDWLDDVGAYLSTTIGAGILEKFRRWVQPSLQSRAPDGATSAVLRVVVASAAVGLEHYIDAATFQRSF